MQLYNKNLKQPSRDLRSNMTDAEQLLWQRLRRKQILGLQFYRQKPILNFIVDFYCSAANLIIECDGGQHYTEDGRLADQIRDQALSELGLVVLRFSNRQILTETDAVVEQIYWIAKQRLESPKSPFGKGGLAVSLRVVFDSRYLPPF
ncbi:endonuclease domain-containing protein [Acinetobacter johnsonii]|uniref:endonuclease domain-containing protein n=2 Tax=Acinetobacter johnsonii TaxID=40214 RepID=UPI0030B0CFB9